MDLSNARGGKVVILTAATEYPERTAREYIDVFERLERPIFPQSIFGLDRMLMN